ncbi:hypothetical protein GCM10010415_73530 [Streptomyces atrovirens]
METVVRRHKTLGAWVPVWTHGPCRNPRCRESRSHEAEAGEAREEAVNQAPTER